MKNLLREKERFSDLFSQLEIKLNILFNSTELNTQIIKKKSAKDFVTNIDLAADSLIKETIFSEFPDDVIISEESANSDKYDYLDDKDNYVWIIDPVDGTTNIACGYPFYATSLHCKYGNTLVSSWIYMPKLGQTYETYMREPSTLNKQIIKVTSNSDLSSALFLAGFKKNTDFNSPWLSFFSVASTHGIGTRRSGSAVVDMCAIASGTNGVYYHPYLDTWDLAACTHLIRNAGGIIKNLKSSSEKITKGAIVAGSPLLVERFISLISNHINDFD